MDDAAIHRISRKANGFVYSLSGTPEDRHGLLPRDDKVWSIVNTRGGDFRSATLYSSPPLVHPTAGFCEAKLYFDNAGPRRVSYFGFMKNPFH
jgi:hypothetical protein